MDSVKNRFHGWAMECAIPLECLARVFLPCWLFNRLHVGTRMVLLV